MSLQALRAIPCCGGRFFAEDVRVTADELAVEACDDVGDAKVPGFLGHLGVEEDLEEEVAEFVGQVGPVLALDRVEDLVGFFQRVFPDGGEGLFAVPGAATGGAQPGHDGDGFCEQIADSRISPTA